MPARQEARPPRTKPRRSSAPSAVRLPCSQTITAEDAEECRARPSHEARGPVVFGRARRISDFLGPRFARDLGRASTQRSVSEAAQSAALPIEPKKNAGP